MLKMKSTTARTKVLSTASSGKRREKLYVVIRYGTHNYGSKWTDQSGRIEAVNDVVRCDDNSTVRPILHKTIGLRRSSHRRWSQEISRLIVLGRRDSRGAVGARGVGGLRGHLPGFWCSSSTTAVYSYTRAAAAAADKLIHQVHAVYEYYQSF